MGKLRKTKAERLAENIAKIPDFCLMHDTYMTAFFSDHPELVEFVLRIILNKDGLTVKRSEVQKPLKSIQGRSITLDVDAVDEFGKEMDIEVQDRSEGAHPKRARYHSSMMDSNALVQRDDFSDLPATYVIFITSSDFFKKGLPVYTVDRCINELDIAFEDEAHIIYVNGDYNDSSPIGKLMHDFKCKNPDEMYYENLAERARALKQTEGGRAAVCRIMEEVGKDYARDEAIAIAEKMLLKGQLSHNEIAEYSGLTLEEVKQLEQEIKDETA